MMLKKIILITMSLTFILGFTACNQANNSISNTNKPERNEINYQKNTSESTQTASSTSQTSGITPAKSGIICYSISESNYIKKDTTMNCDIKYPKVIGLNDLEVQNKVNNIIKEEAIKVLNYYEGINSFLDLKIQYTISLQDQDLLSIQYTGIGDVQSAAHQNNLFYTTNIDLKNGNRLRLDDFINLNDDFSNKLLNGSFKAVYSWQYDALSNYTEEKLNTYFKEADSLDNVGTDKQSDVYSYFTKEFFGISISTGYALGGHAEFQVKLKDIVNDLKPDTIVMAYVAQIRN